MRARLLGLAALALAVVMLVRAGEDRPRTDEQLVFGVHEPLSWLLPPEPLGEERVADLIAGIGAESHRWIVSWTAIEPQPPVDGVHRYDFSRYDGMYQADLRRGIRPLVYVVDAPSWAWARRVPRLGQGYGIPPGPRNLDDWADFVAAVVRRYPKLLALEVWNEPNHVDFWGRGLPEVPPDPAYYTRMLEAAYEAAKSVDRTTVVLGGALGSSPKNTRNGNLGAGMFAEGMFAAGAAAFMDGLSVHAYPYRERALDGSPFSAALDRARAARVGAGVDLPIWITELGASTTNPRLGIGKQRQAQIYAEALEWAAGQPDVAAVFFHALTDAFHGGRRDPERGFGLVRTGAGSIEPTPAYEALRAATER